MHLLFHEYILSLLLDNLIGIFVTEFKIVIVFVTEVLKFILLIFFLSNAIKHSENKLSFFSLIGEITCFMM